MATSRKREIRDQDVQGLKCLRKIRPLLSRLRKVGTERDRAGNRRLFMDQYCALILMSLFSPAIESLRDLQRVCALDKVRKRLGVSRVSLGSLSELVAIFDPAPLKEIATELGHTIRSRPDHRFDAVGQRITAVDGTVIDTVTRVAELSWTPKAKGKHLSAYRLHTHSGCSMARPCESTPRRRLPRGMPMSGQSCSGQSRPTAATSLIAATSVIGFGTRSTP
jgi:hypothetical protein